MGRQLRQMRGSELTDNKTTTNSLFTPFVKNDVIVING